MAIFGQGTFHYRVQGQQVAGARLPAYLANSGNLILVTSAGSGSFDPLAANHLVYVDAKLQGSAITAPPGRPTTVASDEQPGRDDLQRVANTICPPACSTVRIYWPRRTL